MSKENDYWRWINLPSTLTGQKTGIRREVKPIGDDWLAGKDRTWEEIDEFINGQVLSRRDYYITEIGTDSTTGRLLAYVELIDEYELLRSEFHQKSLSERELYDREKLNIRRSTLKEGEKQKRIKGLWSKYESVINVDVERSLVAEHIEKLFLRQAVLDIFSNTNNHIETGEPLILNQFPVAVDRARWLQASGRIGHGFATRDSLTSFITRLSQYLTATEDPELFERHTYRLNHELISTTQEAETLASSLNLILSREPDNQEQINLAGLGQAYWTFLTVKAKAREDIQYDKYPGLSLIYDTFLVSLYKGNIADIKAGGQLASRFMESLAYTSQLEREAVKAGSVLARQSIASADYLIDHMELNQEIMDKSSQADHGYFANLPEIILRRMTSPELQISGLETMDINEHTSPLFDLTHEALNELRKINNTMKASYVREIRLSSHTTDQIDIMSNFLTRLIPIRPIHDAAGIEISLYQYLSNVESMARNIYQQKINTGEISPKRDQDRYQFITRMLFNQEPISSYESEEKRKLIRHAFDARETDGSARSQRGIMSDYLHLYQGKETGSEMTDRENAYFWQEILNSSEWFVSPRGDQFTGQQDPELPANGLAAVTFFMDNQHPREYRVLVRLNDVDYESSFWLDIRRNLLDQERQVYIADPKQKANFLNLILRRLYFITSGILSNKENRLKEGEAEEDFILEYRRAHYRKLRSTTARKITMASHGAMVHAQEIKDIYGIDIFTEMIRRRGLGTLKANEYLTFVKEVVPDYQGRNVLPNTINYDPTLIHLPF